MPRMKYHLVLKNGGNERKMAQELKPTKDANARNSKQTKTSY